LKRDEDENSPKKDAERDRVVVLLRETEINDFDVVRGSSETEDILRLKPKINNPFRIMTF